MKMVSAADILDYVDRIAAKFKPQKIILFGSYAYGTPNGDSDVDLLVVMNHRGPHHHKAIQIRLALPASFPMDLEVRSQREIERRIEWNDWFIKEITEKGLVLYAADNPGVGDKGRKRLRHRRKNGAIAEKVTV